MKRMKKLFALLMTLAMVMGLGITGFADSIVGNSDDRGRISVSGITYEEGIEVTAYKIIEATYDSNGNFSGYNSLYPNVITNDEIKSINATNPDDRWSISQEELNTIYATITSSTSGVNMEYASGTTYTADNVEIGSYLVIITGAEAKVYNPVVVSVDYGYDRENNENTLNNGSVDVEASGHAWVKVSDVPGIEKTIEAGETDVKGNSVNIGETVSYNVTINSIPNYGGDHPILNVVDNLSAGLTYVTDSLEVNVENSDGEKTLLTLNEDYTFTPEGQKLTVNFVVNGKYTLNDYFGQKVVITYSAKVNDKAVVNAGGNNNDVTLYYTTDSKTEGNDDFKEDKTYTYTFDIDGKTTGTEDIITKVGEGEDTKALAGAEFTLYTDSECRNVYKNSKFDGTKIVSDSEGQLFMEGLAAGTYYLKETKAPGDYSLNTNVFDIVIAAEYNTDGTLKEWTVTIDGTEAASFTVAHTSGTPTTTPDITGIDIQNTKLTALPSTGGMGTTLFTIAGCVIMISAAGLFFATRKKAN